MTRVPNHALRQLRAGKLAIGLGLRQARTVDIAQIAQACGFDWLFIDCEHNSMDLDTACQIATASLAVGVTPLGVANAHEIAAVRGIDALLVGTNDLCFELGIPGQFNDARVAEAYQRVIAACRKHGKFAGMGGMYTPELLERHIAMGVQLVLSGSDFSLLMSAGRERASLVRGFQQGDRP